MRRHPLKNWRTRKSKDFAYKCLQREILRAEIFCSFDPLQTSPSWRFYFLHFVPKDRRLVELTFYDHIVERKKAQSVGRGVWGKKGGSKEKETKKHIAMG